MTDHKNTTVTVHFVSHYQKCIHVIYTPLYSDENDGLWFDYIMTPYTGLDQTSSYCADISTLWQHSFNVRQLSSQNAWSLVQIWYSTTFSIPDNLSVNACCKEIMLMNSYWHRTNNIRCLNNMIMYNMQ